MLLPDKIKINMSFDVKITTGFNVLDLIAPFTCRGCGALGSLLCERCKNYNIVTNYGICARCRKTLKACHCEVPVVFCSYREGVLVRLTEDYKYKSIRATAEVLAEIMAGAVKELALCGTVLVVPLPTIAKHIRERGFDHTLLLARRLARELKRDYKACEFRVERVLKRRNKTVQVGTSEATRRKQAKSAYGVSKRYLRKAGGSLDAEVTYLLVDDVWTTGASMEAAISAMREVGARKMAAVVILAPKD